MYVVYIFFLFGRKWLRWVKESERCWGRFLLFYDYVYEKINIFFFIQICINWEENRSENPFWIESQILKHRCVLKSFRKINTHEKIHRLFIWEWGVYQYQQTFINFLSHLSVDALTTIFHKSYKKKNTPMKRFTMYTCK